MSYRLAAEATLLLHLGFIVFVVLGGLLVWRWRWVVVVHLPAAAWGAFVELSGRLCPLTTLENHFRQRAGQAGYSDGFIEHYLLAIVYPEGLTRGTQLVLAGVVVAVNAAIYAGLWWRWRRSGSSSRSSR